MVLYQQLFVLVYCFLLSFVSFFFFNDTATTEIYTLSLHDALPISPRGGRPPIGGGGPATLAVPAAELTLDRKSTRLNSSHLVISYAVFCLKKKKKIKQLIHMIMILLMLVPITHHSILCLQLSHADI